MAIRILVGDVDVVIGVHIPRKYRKCFRIPMTNMWMFCRWPLNYPYAFMDKSFMFLLNLHGRIISWVMRLLFVRGVKRFDSRDA